MKTLYEIKGATGNSIIDEGKDHELAWTLAIGRHCERSLFKLPPSQCQSRPSKIPTTVLLSIKPKGSR